MALIPGKTNKLFFFKLILAYFLLHFIITVSFEMLKSFISFLPLFYVLEYLFTIFIYIGLLKICLNFYDKKNTELVDLFSQKSVLLSVVLASILYVIFIFIGLVFLIIPGIYIFLRLWFYDFSIVDKKSGIMESLKESWEITRGNVLNLFFFFFVILVLNVLGIITLLVGLFITFPISFLAICYVYKELSKKETVLN